jgi:KDO2-lipid IV(A) lauroyltransferase
MGGCNPLARHNPPTPLTLRRFLFSALLRLFSWLPLPVAHALGAGFGRLSGKTSARLRNVISCNLDMCLPTLAPAEKQRIARSNLAETGKNFTELGAFWCWRREQVIELVKHEHSREVLDRAMAVGKGVIVAAPHMGSWELIGLHLTCRHPMHFLYQPGKHPQIDAVVIAARERFGGKCHAISRGGMKNLVAALKRGEIIGVLPDQEPADQSGVFADFGASPAYTMTFLGNLARRNRTPVVFAAMRRLPRGAGYELHYLQPGDDLYSKDSIAAATELNRCVQRCIDLAPDQYMWNYKRYRRAPDGKTNRYA